VCPAPLGRDAARFTDWDTVAGTFTYEGEGEDKVGTFHPSADIDWDAWVADVDEHGRGWSSTESRLFEVVAALVVDDRKLALTSVLD